MRTTNASDGWYRVNVQLFSDDHYSKIFSFSLSRDDFSESGSYSEKYSDKDNRSVYRFYLVFLLLCYTSKVSISQEYSRPEFPKYLTKS